MTNSCIKRGTAFCESLELRRLLSANVLSNHNDLGSTGDDLSETVLTPATVGSTNAAGSISTNFGRLFDTSLDGNIYAQPLAIANVNITRGSSQGIHNIILAATMHDSLYALDANTGAILWQDNFTQIVNPQVTTIGSPSATAGVKTVPAGIIATTGIGPELGILSTPTIDPTTSIIYLLANTVELRNGSTPAAGGADEHLVQRLWALKLADGSVAVTPSNPSIEPTSGGQIVGDTIIVNGNGNGPYEYVAGPYIKGTGNNDDTFNSNGSVATTNNADNWTTYSADTTSIFAGSTPSALGYIAFNALLQMNRVALTLLNGEVYVGFASHADDGPYYGWLLGYSASTLANTAAFITVPNYDGIKGSASYTSVGGLWASGASITTDGTYLYFAVGNGSFNPATGNFSSTYVTTDGTTTVEQPLDGDYGDSVLKVQFDSGANQANVNLSNESANHPTPTGTYNADGGYDENGFGMKVVDYFTPSNVFELNDGDADLGSAGILLIPSTGPGSMTAPDGDPMLVLAGKEGRIYLLDADDLGGFNTQYITDGNETTNNDPAPYDRVLGEYYYYETLPGNSGTKANNQSYKGYDTPSYFNGEFYIALGNDSAPQLGFAVSSFFFSSTPHTGVQPAPNFVSTNLFGLRGSTASISANGSSNGIIWNLDVNQSSSDYLVAYNTAGSIIFNSNWSLPGAGSNTSDTLTNGVSSAAGVKFSLPTVFNGMVYAATACTVAANTSIGTIVGYGLLSSQLTSSTFGPPTALSATATTSTTNHLTWTSQSPLATEFEIDRSPDGGTWTTLQYVPTATTSYDDPTAAAGSSYFYRVRAISGSSTTTFSECVISDGTAAGDTYYLRINPSNTGVAQMFVNTPITGTPAYTFAPSSLTTVIVDSAAGNDSFTVDFTSGDPIPPSGVTYDGGTGANVLIVDGNSSGNAVSIGANTVALAGSTITYANNQSLTVNGGAGNDTLTQTAQPQAASVIFNGMTGADVLNVNSGTFTFSTNPQSQTANLIVNDNSSVVFTAAAASSGINLRALAALNIASGSSASLGTSAAVADRLVLVLNSLSISSTNATLNLGDNDLLLHNGNSAAIYGLLEKGRNTPGGYWNGSDGILSSAAAANSLFLTALGEELDANSSNAPLTSSFDGQPAVATDVLIKYTFNGDANLDGVVNGSDYTLIDTGFNNSLNGWRNGDFNYDGVVNGDDYTLIDSSFNRQTPTIPAIVAQTTQQPKPPSIPVAVSVGSSATPDIRRTRLHSIWSDLPWFD